MKYKLFNTPEEFNAKEVEMMTAFGIPDGKGTVGFNGSSEGHMINNPEHADYGLFAFGVKTEGAFKADQHFDASELVDFDSNWFVTPEENI